jgi:CRP-like cAMP-binding protein
MSRSFPCTADHLRTLSQSPLFTGLDAEALDRIAAISRIHDFPEETILFDAGATAEAFFCVLKGQARLTTVAPSGDETVIAIIEQGDTFAEAALFGSGLYPVDGVASTGSRLARVDGPGFTRLLKEDKGVARAILSSLFRRQADLAREIRFLRATPPVERLASYLLGLLHAHAWSGEGRLPVSKQLIASRIGIEPESLSRSLLRLQHLNLVTLEPELKVIDTDALAAFCGDASSRLGLS